MRIEKVIIQNVNSLAGRFEVDFTDRGYSGGLFAIVGPSGAGKTTVLDAICLALYGQTPRIGAISMTQDELMTKGMSFCSAEAVFVSRGKRYKAAFSHKRSSGKDPFRAVEREIIEYTADGFKTIASSIREADAKIAEITGLDYTRFTRSILLAQFRFAEFLKASANERAEILEQVTDMGLYRRISAAVFERARSEEAALDQIRMRSSLIAVPDEAEEAALLREQKRLEGALPAQARLREALRQCSEALARISGLDKTLADDTAHTPELQKSLAESEESLTGAQQAEERMAAARDALRMTLKTVRALDIQIDTQRKECGRLDGDAKKQEAAVLEHKKRIVEVFRRYEPEADGPRLKAMYEADDTASLLRAGVQAELDEAIKKQQAVNAKIVEWLDGQDAAYWQARVETLCTGLALLETREAAQKARQEQESENRRRAELEEQLGEAKANAAKIEEMYTYAKLGEKFGEERRKLEDGKPCPLCGAVHHPLAGQEHDQSFLKQVEKQHTEADAAVLQVEKEIAACSQRQADIIKRIAELEQGIRQHEEALGGELPKASAYQVKAELDDAQKRVREYPALLLEQAAAADEVGKLKTRMGEIDKDVQAVMMRKEQIGEAQKQADALREELKKAQGVLEGYRKQRMDLFGNKEADAEEAAAEKAAKDAQTAKEQRRAERDKASAALEQNGRDIVRICDALKEEQAGLVVQYETARAQAKGMEPPETQDALYAAFAQAAAALGEAPEKAAITAAAEALEALHADGTERKAIIVRSLSEIAQNRKALRELKAAEREQKQRVEKWGRLNLFIGSSKGDKFSRMAQGITFDALLRYANVSLSRMTDRYILVRETSGGTKPLELAVVDTYQAGEKRPVSNLSGGESFLVSLSLALGLSEMSSGRARIDSLFIDEGFASLDENYLEAALQTLSTLSSREGKLVGVISHMEALKERIDTQIEVRKRSGGRSTISGPGVTAGEA